MRKWRYAYKKCFVRGHIVILNPSYRVPRALGGWLQMDFKKLRRVIKNQIYSALILHTENMPFLFLLS